MAGVESTQLAWITHLIDFGRRVKLAIDSATGLRYAVKIMNNLDSFYIQREIHALNNLNHRYLVNMVEILPVVEKKKRNGVTTQVSVIVLEYAACGALFSHIYWYPTPFSEDIARYYFRQLMEGNYQTSSHTLIKYCE